MTPESIKSNIPEKPEFIPSQKYEAVFEAVIGNKLLDAWEASLADVDFSEEEIEEFKKALSERSHEDLLQILAVPLEIRTRQLASYKRALSEGRTTVHGIVKSLHQNAVQNGFRIGYHVSAYNIQPSYDSVHREHNWVIRATEFDDRDEMKMAYYSFDYMNLFRKKPGSKYLYLVRAEAGENSSHKKDTSNNWGRAPALAIIEQLDLREVDELVEEKFKSENENRAVA